MKQNVQIFLRRRLLDKWMLVGIAGWTVLSAVFVISGCDLANNNGGQSEHGNESQNLKEESVQPSQKEVSYAITLEDNISHVFSPFEEEEFYLESLQRGFGRLRGESAQVMRLLLWALVDAPEVRKELLTQWLSDVQKVPRKEPFLDNLRLLMKSLSQEQRETREAEAIEVLDLIPEEKKKRRAEGKLEGNRTGLEILDGVVNRIHEDLFGFFSLPESERREIFLEVPEPAPPDFELFDYYSYYVYFLFWWIEESDSIRREILLPRMEKLVFWHEDEFPQNPWMRAFGPFLSQLTPEEKQKREKEIRGLKIYTYTDEDNARLREGFEEMMRQIEEIDRTVGIPPEE